MKSLRAPAAWPLAGHLPAFLPDKLGFLTRCAAEYGDVVPLKIGRRTWLLNDADCIRHVLVDNASNYGKTRRMTSARGKRLWGKGLHTAQGAAHLRLRRSLQPGFSQTQAGEFLETIRERTRRQMRRWCAIEAQTVQLAAETESLALRILLAAVFGPDFDDGVLIGPVLAWRRFIEHMYGFLAPFPEHWPVAAVRNYRRARPAIENAIARALDRPHPLSLVARFASAQFPDGARMDRTQQGYEVFTMLSTGYETMGDTLAWTLHLLARHPEIEARVLAELERVTPGREPSLEDIGKLTYLRQVWEESMRLYPPTWIFVRVALDRDALPGGIRIRAGDQIYLCPFVTHRSSRYFPDPLRFDPGRFERDAVAQRPRFSYFPFGGGVHQCLGEQFARLEAVTVLAMIVPRFRFVVDPGESIPLRPAITLQAANGLPARIVRRTEG